MEYKIRNIIIIRLVRFIQIFLVLFGVYLQALELGYVSAVLLLIAAGLEFLVPSEYSWGLYNKKNVFFGNRSVWFERIFIISLILVTTFVIYSRLDN